MTDEGDASVHEPTEDLPFVSYRDFGEQFFTRVVTQERVIAAVDVLAGQPIAFGPVGVGPGRLVKVTADGAIGAATGGPVFDPDHLAYRVELPVDLRFDLDLGVEVHTFEGSLVVPLVLTVRAVDGLRVYVDVAPPRARDIGLTLKAQGLRASLLQRVAGVEGEVRRFVARYVAVEVEKPEIRRARVFDVGHQVDLAWSSIAPWGVGHGADHHRRLRRGDRGGDPRDPGVRDARERHVSEPAYAMGDGAEITYEDFGRRLFEQVLHEGRIEESVATVLGDRIELGPFGAGPGRFLAKVRAVGTIGRPRATRLPAPLVTFRVLLPIDVTFDLDIAVDVHTFRATSSSR